MCLLLGTVKGTTYESIQSGLIILLLSEPCNPHDQLERSFAGGHTAHPNEVPESLILLSEEGNVVIHHVSLSDGLDEVDVGLPLEGLVLSGRVELLVLYLLVVLGSGSVLVLHGFCFVGVGLLAFLHVGFEGRVFVLAEFEE